MKILSQEELWKELRQQCDLRGQANVAKSVGVSQSHMHSLYHGKVKISERVANGLGYTVLKKYINENDIFA
jgi:DNA-binding XRE family transcriptional regulator